MKKYIMVAMLALVPLSSTGAVDDKDLQKQQQDVLYETTMSEYIAEYISLSQKGKALKERIAELEKNKDARTYGEGKGKEYEALQEQLIELMNSFEGEDAYHDGSGTMEEYRKKHGPYFAKEKAVKEKIAALENERPVHDDWQVHRFDDQIRELENEARAIREKRLANVEKRMNEMLRRSTELGNRKAETQEEKEANVKESRQLYGDAHVFLGAYVYTNAYNDEYE